MNKQTSNIFDMHDPFAIVVQSNTGIHQCPEKFLVHSPEYYFVMHYKHLNKALTTFQEVAVEGIANDIQYMADSLMKNLVFRILDIPVSTWALLEPMGSLGRQYMKVYEHVFPEQTPMIPKFVECYEKCKSFDWKDHMEDDQLLLSVEGSIKQLAHLYAIYFQLASADSKSALATVLDRYTDSSDSDLNTDGAQSFSESSHTYYFKQVTPNYNVNILNDITFNWDLSKVQLTLGESVNRSVINGFIVDLGVNCDREHPFVRYQEALLNIAEHLQTADNIYLGYLCEQYLKAANIQFRELPLLGIFATEPKDVPLSTLIDKSEQFSAESMRPTTTALVNAFRTLENYHKYSMETVCDALAAVTDFLATEVENLGVFEECLEVEDYINFIKGLDRFKNKDLDNYRIACSGSFEDTASKFSQEYFEKHLVELYHKPAICISMFPSAKAINLLNSL